MSDNIRRVTPDEPLTLDTIYHAPDPYASMEGHARHTHADLPTMPRAEAVRELKRLELRLLLDDSLAGPDPWFLQRLARLREKVRA